MGDPGLPPSVSDTAAAPALDALTDEIARIESVVAQWEQSQRATVSMLREAVESLHREALRRLIRALKDDPACGARLREALGDEFVYGVLRFHGLVKASLGERIDAALASVRPLMEAHGGGVELVAIKPPDTVELRLVGACHGCPSSGQTLTEGVEKAIREHCPEIEHIHQVSRAPPPAKGDNTVQFVSPFALAESNGWVDAARLDALPDGDILECQVRDTSVLLYRRGERISCVGNACAHLGMPLDGGDIEDGIITCRYHGFRYLLETGECLTVPEVQLHVHAVRVLGDRVQVKLS